MTAPLPVRVSALREKLIRLEELSSRAAEASELSDLRMGLSTPSHALTILAGRQALFNEWDMTVVVPESLKTLRKRARAVRERFKGDRRPATLKKGTTWNAMLADAKAAHTDLDSAQFAAWREFRSVIFSGNPPGNIEGRLAGTKENLEALAAYKTAYEQFSRLFQSLPTDQVSIERAKSLADELVKISGRFDFHVKPEVRAFLEAVQKGGAPLSSLTTDVLDWLKSGNAMDSYRIRAVDTQ